MSLYEFSNPDGTPNVGAAYVNALMDCALYHNDKPCADLYAATAGLTLLGWDNDQTSFRPDSVVFRDASNGLVVFSGTTNIPQWVVHVAGSVIPAIDDVTLDSIMASVRNGMNETMPLIMPLIQPIINSRGTVKIAGHSYGGACAFTLCVWLRKLQEAITECMTFGEPKCFGGLRRIPEPEIHFRIVSETLPDPIEGIVQIDPVSQLPPSAVQYMGLGYLIKIAALVFSLKFTPRGTLVRLSETKMAVDSDTFLWSVPFVSEYLLAFQLDAGTRLHLMDTAYLPMINAAWQRSGLYPELHEFDGFYASYTDTPYVAPTVYGPPLPYAEINQSLELQETPISSANSGDWTNVSSVGVIIGTPADERRSSVMTLMKGSLLCGIMNQGFSESFHSASTSDSYASMQTKMQAIANARMGLSNGVNDNPPLAPNNNMSIVAFRISDELLNRDVFAPPVTTPFGWNGSTGNMDGQQAVKVVWRNEAGAQIAVTYLHGIPNSAVTANIGNEMRTSPMTGTWKTVLTNYCTALRNRNLGFATINNTPSNALGAISAPTYNTVTGYYTFTTENVVPQGRFRVALRGFKSLRLLNGRQSAVNVGLNQFTVFKRAPQIAWDNTGSAVPLSGYNNFVPFSNYIIQVPASAAPTLLCTKKLGRPFFLQAGRVSRVAA